MGTAKVLTAVTQKSIANPLLEQDHLLRRDLVAGRELVEVDARGHRVAGVVATVPDDRVLARRHRRVDETANSTARHVVDRQARRPGGGQGEADHRLRVERIRLVLIQREARRRRVGRIGAGESGREYREVVHRRFDDRFSQDVLSDEAHTNPVGERNVIAEIELHQAPAPVADLRVLEVDPGLAVVAGDLDDPRILVGIVRRVVREPAVVAEDDHAVDVRVDARRGERRAAPVDVVGSLTGAHSGVAGDPAGSARIGRVVVLGLNGIDAGVRSVRVDPHPDASGRRVVRAADRPASIELHIVIEERHGRLDIEVIELVRCAGRAHTHIASGIPGFDVVLDLAVPGLARNLADVGIHTLTR